MIVVKYIYTKIPTQKPFFSLNSRQLWPCSALLAFLLRPFLIYKHYRHLYSVSVESGILIGLDGAIQRLIINGETSVNLQRKSLDSHKIRDYQGAPCRDNPCDNGGVCVPYFRKPVCSCARGYRGKYCKQRDSG